MTSQLTNGPFTIGIFGEWRTGKTSLMRMVEDCLDDQGKIVTVPPHRGRMENFSTSLLKRLKTRDAAAFKERLPLIGPACGHSPRAMVRFVNNLLIDEAINLALKDLGAMEEIQIKYFAITRALQQTWPRMFDLLERTPAVCKVVVEWDPEDPDYGLPEEGSPGANAIAMLADPDLDALLSSDPGYAWLEDGESRTAAIQFLETQRRDTAVASAASDSILVACAEDSLHIGHSVASILRSYRYQAAVAISEQLPPAKPGTTVVWILGSDWQRYEDDLRLGVLVDAWYGSQLFLLQLPLASESTVPSRTQVTYALELSSFPIQEDDLQPLISALQRSAVRYAESPSRSNEDMKGLIGRARADR